MISRRLSVFREPAFLSLIDLFRGADVGIANLETLLHEYEHTPGVAGGTYTGCDPSIAEDLKWARISMVGLANNHSDDYGEAGLLATLRHLRAAGLCCAGAGRNRSEARAPSYLDSARGRVALIAVSSTVTPHAMAQDQRPDAIGRPGINGMRHTVTHTVDRAAFEELRRIHRKLGFAAAEERLRSFRPGGPTDFPGEDRLSFSDRLFVPGEKFGTCLTANPDDVRDNLKWVREARQMADWVFVGFHCHESGETADDPPDFLVEFARACVDEGADGFFGHGPHVTRGIEIYKGKPIFYSLGNFVFQSETVRWQPSVNYEALGLNHTATPSDFYDARTGNGARGFPADPVYWESIVARCQYRGGKLRGLTLHPIDLGYGRPRYRRGRPVLARPPVADSALSRVRDLSRRFGVEVVISGGVGAIAVQPPAACASRESP